MKEFIHGLLLLMCLRFVAGQEDDPKESFFKYLEARPKVVDVEDLPNPGGLDNAIERSRRNADDALQIAKQIEADVAKRIGKPVEIIVVNNEEKGNSTGNNASNIVELVEDVKNEKSNYTKPSEDILILNDFIRFKRNSEMKDGKMDEGKIQDGNREPRGAIKEQWIKQPYPVQSEELQPDDYRAPRVHFVTHRLTESAQTPYSYHRTPRMRDYPMPDTQDYMTMRPTGYNAYQDDVPYYRRNKYDHYEDRDRPYYYPRYESSYDRYYGPEHYSSSYNRQRRIIYYATLPEVVRTPPRSDLRSRYPYRDYDDRYEPYPYGKPKTRYEEEAKTPYPLKVSTDVNVSEIKKNPGRRIYSESERRYPSKGPNFEPDDGGYKRL